jgi:ribosomal protein S3
VFYYIGQKNRALNDNTINNLGDIVRKLFGRPVELRFVKLHYPFLNRIILAKFIRLNVNRRKFKRVIKKLLNKGPLLKFKDIPLIRKDADATQVLPAIQGIKFKLSGRPLSQRPRPRKTIIKKQVGTFYKDHKTSFIDYSKFTTKNKRGAYTVKVWISQLLFLKS